MNVLRLILPVKNPLHTYSVCAGSYIPSWWWSERAAVCAVPVPSNDNCVSTGTYILAGLPAHKYTF